MSEPRIPTPEERRATALAIADYLLPRPRATLERRVSPVFVLGVLRALDIAESALEGIRGELDVEPGFRIPAGGAWKMASDALARLRGES